MKRIRHAERVLTMGYHKNIPAAEHQEKLGE